MDTKEYTMRELTDIELDEVAGGDPFGNLAVAAVTQAVANIGFTIGHVALFLHDALPIFHPMNLCSREPRKVKFALADGDAQARPRLRTTGETKWIPKSTRCVN